METLQRLPFKARNAVFQRLEQIVDIAAMSKEDRMKYDESIKVYRDRLAIMEFERLKGEQQGFLKGKSVGLTEGKMIEKEAIARSLKQAGMTTDFIAQITGLSPETIALL